jgi:peptidoglycan hydrolase-like protein with peptidoglycan-binding domain
MPILTETEIRAALDYNAGRDALKDPDLVGAIQESLGIARSGKIDRAFVEAVAAWQMQQGLEVDGKVGPKTERSLRRALSPQPAPLHGLPPITRRWGFDHAELRPFPYSDTQLEAITGTGSWTAGAIRLVAGYDAGRRTVNRGLDSFTTLDTFSIGIAHWWADTAPELLAEIARREPNLAAWAWGRHTAEQLEDEDWLPTRHPPRRGKKTLQPELHWLLSGWWACARHPSVASIQCELWLDKYVGRARTAAKRLGWEDELMGSDGGKILVALARAANSGRGSTQIRQFRQGDGALAALKRFYLADRDDSPRGYDKPDRWKKIVAWNEFDGPAPDASADLLQGLDFSVAVQRHDGSTVVFPASVD